MNAISNLMSQMNNTPKHRVAIWAMLGIFSLTSMFACVKGTGPQSYWGIASAPFLMFEAVLAPIAFGRMAIAGNARNAWYWLLAFLFAAFTIVGQSLKATQSLYCLGSSGPSIAFFAVKLLGAAIYFYTLFDFVDWAVQTIIQRQHIERDKPQLTFRGRSIRVWHIALFFFACWLPYVIVFFPGTIPTDTSRQLAQWFGAGGVSLDNHFPFLTTIAYGSIYSVAYGVSSNAVWSVFALTAFQIIVGIASCTYIVWIFVRQRCPRWICWGAILFFGLFPIFPTYVVSASKDFLHALCVALLVAQTAFQVATLQRSTPRESLQSWLLIVVFSLLVCLTRNNGFALAFIAVAATAIATRSRAGIAATATVITGFLLWNAVVLPSCEVGKTESREMLSMPAQIVARMYYDGSEPTEAQQAAIDAVTTSDARSLAQSYDFHIADPAKGILDIGETSQMIAFISTSLELAAAHPSEAAAAALGTTYEYWYPFSLGTYWPEDVPYFASSEWSLIDSGWMGDASWTAEWNDVHTLQSRVLHFIHANIPGLSHLYRPGTYCWLLLFAMTFALQRNRNRALTCVTCLPLLCLLATLILGPCASLRYTLPFIACLPIIAFVLFYQQTDRPAPSDKRERINA